MFLIFSGVRGKGKYTLNTKSMSLWTCFSYWREGWRSCQRLGRVRDILKWKVCLWGCAFRIWRVESLTWKPHPYGMWFLWFLQTWEMCPQRHISCGSVSSTSYEWCTLMGILFVFEGGEGRGKLSCQTWKHGHMSMLMCLAAYLRQVGHRSPPYRILTWWRSGVGREAHCHIKTWNGGLLLDTEALHVMFDTMEGWIEKFSVALKHEREGGQRCSTITSKPKMGQWQAVAKAEQEKSITQGVFLLFGIV